MTWHVLNFAQFRDRSNHNVHGNYVEPQKIQRGTKINEVGLLRESSINEAPKLKKCNGLGRCIHGQSNRDHRNKVLHLSAKERAEFLHDSLNGNGVFIWQFVAIRALRLALILLWTLHSHVSETPPNLHNAIGDSEAISHVRHTTINLGSRNLRAGSRWC